MECPVAGYGENVMNFDPEHKYLIDAYIDEVGLNLPKKNRTDIAIEIRSLILDALEDRSASAGVDPDEEMVLEVLKEIGSPLEMAASYHKRNYVIGPSLYAPFWVTVRGTLLFMAFFYILGFMISWDQATLSASAFGSALWGLIVSFLKNALQNFSVIFLVFIILERILPEQDWFGQIRAWGAISQVPFVREVFGRTTSARIWDPAALVATPKSERIKRTGTIIEIAIIILAAILFNFFAHKVGPYGIITESGPWFAPLLAPSFGGYLPWWNLYWLLSLGLNFILLARSRWSRLTRWLEIGLMTFSGVLVYWMLKGPPVIGLTQEYLILNNTSPEAIRLAKDTLIPILTTLFNIALVLHLVVKVPTIAYKFFKLVGKPPVFVLKSSKGEVRSD
jgi:hypothetical protein